MSEKTWKSHFKASDKDEFLIDGICGEICNQCDNFSNCEFPDQCQLEEPIKKLIDEITKNEKGNMK